MHIPTCQTQELEILTFEQALVPTQWDFDREKWLYIPDHYAGVPVPAGDPGRESPDLYRDQPLHRGAGDLDNTLKSVERIAAATATTAF